ncbi:MAG: hypothetical protein IKN12_04885 [Selenomonadaceae bacterium]|nr:hypothetical protein [Selenomonadaceae bacterium]
MNGISSFDSNELESCDVISSSNDNNGNTPNTDNHDIYIVNKIVETWQEQHRVDIEMRKNYAKYLIWLAAGTTIVIVGVFVAIGLEKLKYDETTIRWFLTVAYIHLLGLVCVIVKYLFSRDSHVILRDIADIVGKLWSKSKN